MTRRGPGARSALPTGDVPGGPLRSVWIGLVTLALLAPTAAGAYLVGRDTGIRSGDSERQRTPRIARTNTVPRTNHTAVSTNTNV